MMFLVLSVLLSSELGVEATVVLHMEEEALWMEGVTSRTVGRGLCPAPRPMEEEAGTQRDFFHWVFLCKLIILQSIACTRKARLRAAWLQQCFLVRSA